MTEHASQANEKTWGKPIFSFPLTLLIGLALIIIVEFIFKLVLDPELNLAYAYVAYLTGYLILFIMGFLIQSKLKMFLTSILSVIVSYIPPYLAPNSFVGLFSPFFLVISHIRKALGLSEVYGIDLSNSSPIPGIPIDTLISIGYLIDLLIAILVVTTGALALTLLAQTLRLKLKAFMTFAFYVSLVFILIFVIILPYILIGISGVAQVGVDTATGAGYFMAGVQKLQEQAFGDAIKLFNEASKWVNGSLASLQGIQDLRLAAIVGLLYPSAKAYLDIGVPMLKSVSYLIQSAGPLTAGIHAISNAFTNLFAYIDSTNSSSVLLASLASLPAVLNAANESQFSLAIDYARESVANLTRSLQIINNALNEQKGINLDNTQVDPSMKELYEKGVDLFSHAISALEAIISPDSTTTGESALVHLLYGLRSLNVAKNKMAGQTMLNGTLGDFQDTVGNFTQVSLAFTSPEVNQFLAFESLNGTSLGDIQQYMTGTIRFFQDALNTTISFGNFGVQVTPIYDDTFTLLDDFSNAQNTYGNITAIPLSEYTNNFIPRLKNIYGNSSDLQATGSSLDAQASLMQTRANNGTYGFLGGAAKDLASFILSINAQQIGFNLRGMSGKYLSLLNAFLSMRLTQDNMNTLNTQFDDFKNDQQLSKINPINQTLININTTLTWTKGNLTLARLNTTIGMDQLSNTDSAILQIETNISNMLVSLADVFLQLQTINDNFSDSGIVNQSISQIDLDMTHMAGNMTEAAQASANL